MKIAAIALLVFTGVVALGFISGEIQAYYNPTTGTRVAVSRSERDTDAFTKSKGFTLGQVRTLTQYKYQWDKASPQDKFVIENTVRQELYALDPDQVNHATTRTWFVNLLGGEAR